MCRVRARCPCGSSAVIPKSERLIRLDLGTLRWKRLKAAHADGNYHDGVAMFKELEALRATTGRAEETRDHDRVVERMRDEFLQAQVQVLSLSPRVPSGGARFLTAQ